MLARITYGDACVDAWLGRGSGAREYLPLIIVIATSSYYLVCNESTSSTLSYVSRFVSGLFFPALAPP